MWGQPQAPLNKFGISITAEENTFFSYCYTLLDPNNQGTINGKDSVTFFKKSNLPVDILKKVWIMTSSNSITLDREEFFTALRLISYAQNGVEVSEQSLQQNLLTPLPRFNDIQLPQATSQPQFQPSPVISPAPQQVQSQFFQQDTTYDMPDDIFSRFDQYYATLDPQNRGMVSGNDAKQLFVKSQLGQEVLKHIWFLCDTDTKGYFTRGEFIVALHLIGLCKKGIQPPAILPESLKPTLNGSRFHQQQPVIQQPPQQQNIHVVQSYQVNETKLEMQETRSAQSSIIINNHPIGSSVTQSQGLDSRSTLPNKSQVNDIINQSVEDKKRDIQILEQIIQEQESYMSQTNRDFNDIKKQLNQLDEGKNHKIRQLQQIQEEIRQQIKQNQLLRSQISAEQQTLQDQVQSVPQQQPPMQTSQHIAQPAQPYYMEPPKQNFPKDDFLGVGIGIGTTVQQPTQQTGGFGNYQPMFGVQQTSIVMNVDDDFSDYQAKKSRLASGKPEEPKSELPW